MKDNQKDNPKDNQQSQVTTPLSNRRGVGGEASPLPNRGGVGGGASINTLQDQIIEEFSDFDEWLDKYQLIIDLGSEQEPLPASAKTEQNLIDGCQSRVWLTAELTPDGLVHFAAESDALIVKGIVSLLIRVLSDHTPQEILDADLYFIDRIGLSEHLSPNRSNGLLAMLRQMKMYALAFKAKNQL